MPLDGVIDHRCFTNDLPELLAPLAQYQEETQGVEPAERFLRDGRRRAPAHAAA